MLTTSISVDETPVVLFSLRRADDALIAGHRLSEWCGKAPTPEEDIALANMGLDLLGQARSLYSHAATLEAAGHDEDDFAYLRDPPQFRNLLLLELPNGDFAQTIMRQFLYAAFMAPWWQAMTRSTDPTLAAIAAKAEKETAYHLRHSAEWVIRLGDGTVESHRRTQDALDLLYPYTGEMFEPADEDPLVAAGVAADMTAIKTEWNDTLTTRLAEASLKRPSNIWSQGGGRSGRHTEHLGFLLAEMQHLPRTHPGATW
jgi:ring-1,2-phenylacetyl-CoA epoxidase subunit PaaC